MAGCHNKLLKRAVSKFVRYLIHPLFIVGLVFILIGLVCSCLLNGYTALGTWFAALGTWLLAWIGFWGVVTAIKAKQREILSGLKIGRVDPSGVAWIKNTSKEWIQFSAWVKDVEDVKFEKCDEQQFSKKVKDNAKAVKDEDFACRDLRYENFKLAPGAKVPIHLKDITIEETYVALAAVKIEIDGDSLGFLGRLVKVEDDERTRVVVYRYAGDMISGREKKVIEYYEALKPNEKLARQLHPHHEWVPVESRKGKSET